MNDRDQLAADLPSPDDSPQPNGRIARKWWRLGWLSANAVATDRLIALGWKRREPSVREVAEKYGIQPVYGDLPVEIVRPAPFEDDFEPLPPAKGIRHGPQCHTLDEERLARAVRVALVSPMHDEAGHAEWYAQTTAAIAKAYREDAG